VVERNHELVIVRREPVQQHAARVEMVHIGVPHREKRGDGFDRGMARADEEQSCGAEIGYAGRPDRAVGPRLARDPLRDLATVLPLDGRAEAVARAEARPRAAHIDDHERVAARDKEVAVLCGIWRVFGTRRRAVLQREAPVVG
jgi:hypothetical protein